MCSLIYFFTKPTAKWCAEDKIYRRHIFAQGARVAIDVDCEGMVGVTGVCLCKTVFQQEFNVFKSWVFFFFWSFSSLFPDLSDLSFIEMKLWYQHLDSHTWAFRLAPLYPLTHHGKWNAPAVPIYGRYPQLTKHWRLSRAFMERIMICAWKQETGSLRLIDNAMLTEIS